MSLNVSFQSWKIRNSWWQIFNSIWLSFNRTLYSTTQIAAFVQYLFDTIIVDLIQRVEYLGITYNHLVLKWNIRKETELIRVCSSETSVSTYKSTRRYYTEEQHWHRISLARSQGRICTGHLQTASLTLYHYVNLLVASIRDFIAARWQHADHSSLAWHKVLTGYSNIGCG
jgi:hypothetical protein